MNKLLINKVAQLQLLPTVFKWSHNCGFLLKSVSKLVCNKTLKNICNPKQLLHTIIIYYQKIKSI